MFIVPSELTTLLRSGVTDLIYVYEIYDWKYDLFPEFADGGLSYDPRYAVALFAGQNVSFTVGAANTVITYQQEVLEGPSINKHISKTFDTATVKFSNVSRDMAEFVLNNRIQGMRLVVRLIPLSAPVSVSPGDAKAYADSIIEFVGRIEKPDNFTRESGTISAKTDIGTIEARIPGQDYQPSCPLPFKKPGGECLGDQLLSEKTPTYQAAKICNKTEQQCIQYGNEKYFQGIKIVQIESSFVHKSNESFFKKVLNILPGISRKKTTVADSIHDGTPYGTPKSVILGRWPKKLIPLQYRDIGTSINCKMAAGRGTIKDFVNIRNNSLGFTQPLGVTQHLGEYGGVGTQTQDTVFPDAQYHSKLAYTTFFCNGSEMETEDPAPDVSSLLAGLVVNKAFGIDGSGTGRLNNVLANYVTADIIDWTDNPADLARFILTDPAYLAVPALHIGELATAITSAYTTGAIKDMSNAEHAIFPASEVSRAGVEYKRYNSTGVLGAANFVGLNGVYDREAEYEFDMDGSLEAGTGFLPVKAVYRKRYTANIELNETKKAIDFLYDTLFACFRGFLRWDHFGRLVIDCERPADHSYLRANVASAATSIKVLDVTRWKPLDVILNLEPPLRGKILIGAGMDRLTSEVRPVSSADYSADGNTVTLDAAVTGALQVDISGGTLSGGSTVSPAGGYVDILGAPQLGDEITITIDGVDVVHTATQEDEDAGAGPWLPYLLSCMINAEPLLNKYIEAQYGSSPAEVDTELPGSWRVLIYCKYGQLNFTTPLEEDHFAELADPEDAPSAATSAGSLNEGTYLLSYAFRNTNGNTNISPILSIDVADSEQIDVDAITPLPAGVDSVDWFISVEANSDVRLLVLNNDGSAFSIDELPAVTAEQEPLRNTTGEEILRVAISFAGKALTYADTTRANVLDGTFTWPEGGKQSTINQVKGTHREAIYDFAEAPKVVNDDRHIEDTAQTNTANIDLSAVDNHNQAMRLLNGYLAKLRDGDFFFKWGSVGEATLLEIGCDVVCVSDDSGEWRNVPVRIEDINLNPRFESFFSARLYSTSQFDDAVLQTQVPLPSALVKFKAPPEPPEFNDADFPPNGLVQTLDGSLGLTSVRGGAIVADSIYAQKVNVRLVKRGGVTVDESIASGLVPNEDGEIVFEFLATEPGLYVVQIQSQNQWGTSEWVEESIVIGLGAAQGLWDTPMVQFSGAGEAAWTGAGSYTIPMIAESGAGEPNPAGGGNFDVP